MQFELAGELYTSKAAIERHYRAIIRNRPAGFVFDLEHPDFAFLHALLMHHDRRKEKMGHSRVREFFVVDVPGAKGLWIRRWDGSETDVSLLKVIQRLGMTDRQRARYDLLRTLRDEIEDQIADYRRCAVNESLAGVTAEFEIVRPRGSEYRALTASHVDHHHPSFAELVEGFLIENDLDYAAIPIAHGERGLPCRVGDREIATAWQEYHRRHATLRLLPADENLRRQTPKVDWQRIDEHVQRDRRRGHDAMDW